MVYLRSLAVWCLLMFTEMLHGTARIFLLVPVMGDFPARQLTVFTGALLIYTIAFLLIKWINPTTITQAFSIGALWVTLTLVFEISLGRFAFNMSWQRIAEDYNLPHGGLMPIGLLLMLLAPYVTAKVRKLL